MLSKRVLSDHPPLNLVRLKGGEPIDLDDSFTQPGEVLPFVATYRLAHSESIPPGMESNYQQDSILSSYYQPPTGVSCDSSLLRHMASLSIEIPNLPSPLHDNFQSEG